MCLLYRLVSKINIFFFFFLLFNGYGTSPKLRISWSQTTEAGKDFGAHLIQVSVELDWVARGFV